MPYILEMKVSTVRIRNYDAVILDVMLPGIDGFEVLRGASGPFRMYRS